MYHSFTSLFVTKLECIRIMLLNIPHNFPALELLAKEQFSISDLILTKKDAKPHLKVAVLNLMPLKIDTEADILRIMSNSPLYIHLDFIYLESHSPKNTSIEHIQEFYKPFSAIKNDKYDGFIVTGAPIELLPFEEVKYWTELEDVFDWARKSVTSSLYICWGAQAALHHFHGIPKYELDNKLFGIYPHTVTDTSFPLFRGFDDIFHVPHSRHTTILKKDISKHPELTIFSETDDAGIYLIADTFRNEFYITGHSEYAPMALHKEYARDMKKGLTNVKLPYNYYPDNDPNKAPLVQWRSHSSLLFTNWLHYFCYYSLKE